MYDNFSSTFDLNCFIVLLKVTYTDIDLIAHGGYFWILLY